MGAQTDGNKPLIEYTARELSNAYAAKTLSPVEVTEETLAHIEAVNPALNAVYEVDNDGALAAAKASEARWQKGEPLSPLDGVATTVKDALGWEGKTMYRGSAAHSPEIATYDAPVAARCIEAGMVTVAKTTMCDMGILASGLSSHHGVTRNPWDTSKNPGGSSSGSAACVTAGIGPVVVGTDIVGSVRLPGSFCGLVGHKPSQGRVPYYFPNAPTLTAGPMARTVDDAALLMNVITQPDARDFTALPYDGRDYTVVDPAKTGLRYGLIHDLGFGLAPDPEVSAAIEQAAKLLEAQGHSLTEIPTPFTPADLAGPELFYKARSAAELAPIAADKQANTPFVHAWCQEAHTASAADLYQAMNAMRSLRERLLLLMQEYDFLLLPSVPVLPYAAELPGHDPEDIFLSWSNTFAFNITQQPGINVNCGFSQSGLPIGLQIVGQRFDDYGVFQQAYQYEKLRDLEMNWPFTPRG